MVLDLVAIQVLEDILQRHRKVVGCGVVFILGLYRDGVRAVGFVVESGCTSERTVRFDTEQGVIIFPSRQVICDGIPFQIGGIEFTDEGTDWLVFGERKCGGRI
jgi:hypothetical protein